MAVNHGQVPHGHLVLVVASIKSTLEGGSGLFDVLLLPVNVSECLPSLGFGGHELDGLRKVLLSLFGVLWDEVKDLSSKEQQVGLFLLLGDCGR